MQAAVAVLPEGKLQACNLSLCVARLTIFSVVLVCEMLLVRISAVLQCKQLRSRCTTQPNLPLYKALQGREAYSTSPSRALLIIALHAPTRSLTYSPTQPPLQTKAATENRPLFTPLHSSDCSAILHQGKRTDSRTGSYTYHQTHNSLSHDSDTGLD